MFTLGQEKQDILLIFESGLNHLSQRRVPALEKHMGDQEKPKNWNMGYYPWYVNKQNRHGKRITS